MDNIEPPSFSLGLDLDAQPEFRLPAQDNPTPSYSSRHCTIGYGYDELDLIISDSDIEPESFSSSRALKRLRKGPNAEKPSAINLVKEASVCGNDWDDEIEDFSSPEDFPTDVAASGKFHSVCSSSKVPLHGLRVLTSQPLGQRKAKIRSQQSDAQLSAGSGASSFASLFRKSTCSPLRRFQLLDSDSEEDWISTSKNVSRVTTKNDLPSDDQQSVENEQKRKKSSFMPQIEDLWKDLSTKSSRVPTPALENFCEEYFGSLKDTSAARNSINTDASSNKNRLQNLTSSEGFDKRWDSADPCPPSHHYFLHGDPRVQNLIRTRLAYFWPLGILNNKEDQHITFHIDYMNQFGSAEASKKEGTRTKVSKTRESLNASEGWLDPKSCSAAPKDAGKRRVCAKGGSLGHWYTSPEGRKVYASRNGQELTGQSAYRCYRKESGGGLGKSGKKRQTKKSKR